MPYAQLSHFRIQRVISDSDALLATSTCRHCGQTFQCDLRKVRLERLLNEHLEVCKNVAHRPPTKARVLQMRSRDKQAG